MTIRSRTEAPVFEHPFRLKGLDRVLSAGSYEALTGEEIIEDLSLPHFRRVLTMIMVPANGPIRAR